MSQLGGVRWSEKESHTIRAFQSVMLVNQWIYRIRPRCWYLSLSFFSDWSRVEVVVGGIVMQCQVLLSAQISLAGWVSIHSRHYLTNLLGQAGPSQPSHHSQLSGWLCFTEGREVRSDYLEDCVEKHGKYRGIIKTKDGINPQKMVLKLKYQIPTIRSSLQSVLQFIFKARNVLA